MHGETGAAKAAPRRLADYHRLDRVLQVQQIMDKLAESRAQACVGALVRKGVAGSRLFITHKGRGGNIRVDFVPRSLNPYAAMPHHHGPVPPLGLVRARVRVSRNPYLTLNLTLTLTLTARRHTSSHCAAEVSWIGIGLGLGLGLEMGFRLGLVLVLVLGLGLGVGSEQGGRGLVARRV